MGQTMSTAGQDARLTEILDAYGRAAREGRAPDREAFLAAHPDLRERLAAALVGLEFIRRASPDLAASAHAEPPGQLGDFRIVGEIGRGGMGVVYEAEQISLNRRVALKVLPFASVLDPKQLQRFRNEAQAAAHLHHTNIVPVHAVGSERGVHYYAMQFIEGESLARAIAELRKDGRGSGGTPISSHTSNREPAFLRMAARVGLQAAEALDHAHQLGVVHRDVKPGNLLVDFTGNLWITDFGLARFDRGENLTMTGDLVGTLRYMSPEQALGKRVPIDHRTDVYSLGATLYELFTLEPAVTGEDPQAVIQEIAFKDPKPPRRLNPAVPMDLETILLKAMAKDPAGRYASAQEMADDLRRFLEHKPIIATRPSLATVAQKWVRRHRPLAAAAAAVLVILVVAFAVSTIVVAGEKRLAEERRLDAERNLKVAREAVDEMLARVGDEGLEDIPMLEPLRRALLERARGFYRGLLERHDEDPDLRHEAAVALARLGTVHRHLGETAEAERALDDAVERLERLQAERPGVAEYEASLARAFVERGVLEVRLGHDKDARASWRNALAHFDALSRRSSAYRQGLALSCARLVGFEPDAESATGLGRRARDLFRTLANESPEDPEPRFGEAMTCTEIGLRLLGESRHKEAAEAYRDAARLLDGLAAERPHVVKYRREAATAHANLANALVESGEAASAEDELRRSVAAFDDLARDFPFTPAFSWLQANARNSLGVALHDRGDLAGAEHHLRDAVAALEVLVAESPMPDHRRELGAAYRNLGDVRADQGDLEEAVRCAARAAAIFRVLVEEIPGRKEYRDRLSKAQGQLVARLFNGLERHEEAVQVWRDALALQERLVAADPAEPAHSRERARLRLSLGDLLGLSGRLDEAEAELRRARDELSDVAGAASDPQPRQWMASCSMKLGKVLAETGRRAEAEQSVRAAILILEGLVRDFPADPSNAGRLAEVGSALVSFGDVAGGLGILEKAVASGCERPAALNRIAWLRATSEDPGIRDAERAVVFAERAVNLAPEDGGLHNTLGVARYRAGRIKESIDALSKSMELGGGGDAFDFFVLAMAHERLGEKERAREWYDRGVAWTEKNRAEDEELRRFRAEAEELLGVG